MAALETVADYITASRRLLQDEIAPYRYDDAGLVEALNLGLTEMRRLRADLFLPLFEVPFVSAGAPVPVDTMYRSSLVYYIVGRTQLRDEEGTQDARAAALMTKFTQQLLVINS